MRGKAICVKVLSQRHMCLDLFMVVIPLESYPFSSLLPCNPLFGFGSAGIR